MEATLGSTAEIRQNGAERPFPEDLGRAHWYAQLSEMKDQPRASGNRLGARVQGRPFHRESTGSCFAEAGMGEESTGKGSPP